MRMMTKFSTCFLKSARRKQWTFSKMPSLLLAETPGTYKSYIYLEEGIGISLMHLRPAILRIPVLGNVQFFDMSTFAFLCTSLTKLYSIAVLKFAGIWRTALSLYRCKGVAAMLLLELYPCWEKNTVFLQLLQCQPQGLQGVLWILLQGSWCHRKLKNSNCNPVSVLQLQSKVGCYH